MAEYKAMREKKYNDLALALSNVRKDLYDWKPGNLKSVIPGSPVQTSQRLQSIDSNSNLKRTGSLKNLSDKSNNINPSNTKLNKIKPNGSTKIAPLSAQSNSSKAKKSSVNTNNDFDVDDDLGLLDDTDNMSMDGNEFLTSFNNKQNSSAKTKNKSSERPYLNSARGRLSETASKSDREQELVIKLNQKDTLSVLEMDLSQYNLKAMKNLNKFPNLKIIDYSCNKITKIEPLNFKNLVELRLFANQIEVLENFENLTELQSLQLQSNRIKKIDKSLQQLKKLEYLRLDQNYIESISISELSSCSNLIYLNVSHNCLSSLLFINCLPNLEELDASYLCLVKLNDIDPSRCPNISEIDLSHNQLKDESLTCLRNFNNLTTLKVSNNNLKSTQHIGNIKTLRNLDISENQIKEITHLVNLTELETLDVSSNQINEWFQIETLVKLNELVELNIKNNPIMTELQKTSKDVSSALPNLKFIDNVPVENIKNNKPVKALKVNTVIEREMEFESNKFGQEIENINQKFMKRFNDIQTYLKKIDDDESLRETSSSPIIIKASEYLPQSTKIPNDRKLTKNRLHDALHYSKQLGDKAEPECNTS